MSNAKWRSSGSAANAPQPPSKETSSAHQPVLNPLKHRSSHPLTQVTSSLNNVLDARYGVTRRQGGSSTPGSPRRPSPAGGGATPRSAGRRSRQSAASRRSPDGRAVDASGQRPASPVASAPSFLTTKEKLTNPVRSDTERKRLSTPAATSPAPKNSTASSSADAPAIEKTSKHFRSGTERKEPSTFTTSSSFPTTTMTSTSSTAPAKEKPSQPVNANMERRRTSTLNPAPSTPAPSAISTSAGAPGIEKPSQPSRPDAERKRLSAPGFPSAPSLEKEVQEACSDTERRKTSVPFSTHPAESPSQTPLVKSARSDAERQKRTTLPPAPAATTPATSSVAATAAAAVPAATLAVPSAAALQGGGPYSAPGSAAPSRRPGTSPRTLAAMDAGASARSSSPDSSHATSTSLAHSQASSAQLGEPALQVQPRPRAESARPATTGQAPAASVGEHSAGKTLAIPPIVRKTLLDFDRIQKLKEAAEKAIRDKKVFMIHGGYPSIRLALKRRGWVEKKYLQNKHEPEDDIDVSKWPLDPSTENPITIGLADVLSLKGSKSSMIMTRLLRDNAPNLIWSARREAINYSNMDRDQLVNHFPRAPFNTKVGLCSLAQNMHWFSESMPADTFIPRAYRIGMVEEKHEFVDDYRLTACVGLLVWFRERFELHGAGGVEHKEGEVPFSIIPTAIQQCQAYIATRQHEDIEPTAFSRSLWPHQWDNFLTNFYKIVHKSKKLEMHRDGNTTIVKVFYNRIVQLLSDMSRYRPQTYLDGMKNIWIVKPGCASRGRGIVLMRHLEEILALVDSGTQREGKWVVQKYIERPMLIYNTKFDIRQWFLVTDWNPLTIWMYKQSYLRFCSQQFKLDDLKEAVHLCNNAVQARYKNGQRHAALPAENMWDTSTFQQFLKGRQAGHAWDQIIYPAMKNAIISICLASQTELEPRKGCFELFGADFLLTEDYHPWLIEVNSSPAMGASTSVTAWLCAMCLEDSIRVIIDRRRNSAADVGEFECILQQAPVSSPRYLGIDLSVHGHRIKPPAGALPPPAPAAPPPAAPRTASVVLPGSRAVGAATRLASVPAPSGVAVGERRRSQSLAPRAAAAAAAAAAASPSAAAAAGTATTERRRSVSQAPARRNQPPPWRRVPPAPLPPAASPQQARQPQQAAQLKPSVQKQPQPPQRKLSLPTPEKSRQPEPEAASKTAAKKAAPARRRSRPQAVQSSVRRLSVPRASRSTVRPAALGSPPRPPLPPPAATPPRNPLQQSARRPEPSSATAQQLVTCGRLQTPEPVPEKGPGPVQVAEPKAGGGEKEKARLGGVAAMTCSASCVKPAGAMAGHARTTATVMELMKPTGTATELMRPAVTVARETKALSAGVRPAAMTKPPAAGSMIASAATADSGKVLMPAPLAKTGAGTLPVANLINNSLDKLERIRQASEEAVRRINSLSLAAPAQEAVPVPAPRTLAPGSASSAISGVQLLEFSQPNKVSWAVARPSYPSGIALSTSAASVAPQSTSDLTRASAPPATARQRQAASTTSADASPAAAPQEAAPRLLAVATVSLTTSISPIRELPAPVPVAVTQPGALVGLQSAAGEQTPAPADVSELRVTASSRVAAPEPRAWPDSVQKYQPPPAEPESPEPSAPVCPPLGPPPLPSLPKSVLPAPPSGPQKPAQPQAFTTRISELKTLIDRAIEETREFLGRARPPARAGCPRTASPRASAATAAAAAAASAAAHAVALTPEPRTRLAPTIVDISLPGADDEERGAAQAGSARGSPRRSSARLAASRAEPSSITDLVGLQGRRFLPELNAQDALSPLARRRS